MKIVAALCLVAGLVAICSYARLQGLTRVVALVVALVGLYGFLVLGHIVPAFI